MSKYKNIRTAACTLFLSLAAACGGGGGGGSGGGDTTPPPPPADKAGASRFLAQATFGPTVADIDRVAAIGYDAWLNEQFALPASLHAPAVRGATDPTARARRLEVWWHRAVRADDQLRQRVAFALSEILVVSDDGAALQGRPDAVAAYYDVLVRGAFGNYRTLLEDVTLSPQMGRYLSMLGNRKPDVENGIRADENYAREVMQLFTIGLVELNSDGTPRRDGAGVPIPTYTQADIEGLARVFTGWVWGRSESEEGANNWFEPMQPNETQHDTGAKTIVGGVQVPPGGRAREDLAIALDTLFAHPNAGPFVGKALIQRLVTSNPSPAYVRRVAAAFADDGHGVRGNLRAVVRAILLDDEALRGSAASDSFGKAREPLLVVTALWRAFGARAASGAWTDIDADHQLGQAPVSAPSVFNFFSPKFSPVGPLERRGLVGPEFQLATESNTVDLSNTLGTRVYGHYAGMPGAGPDDILIDVSRERALAAQPQQLVEHLDLLLTGNRLGSGARNALVGYLQTVPAGDGMDRALDAIFMVISSPQYLARQ